MSITNLVQQMLILLIFLVIGVIANKTGILDPEANKKFSSLLLNITQPAMVLASAVDSQLDIGPADILRIILYGCAMYAVLIVLAYALSPLYRTELSRKRVYRFMTIFGNVAFMGFPVVSAVFGSDAVLIASLYCIPFNLLCYSVGVLMLSGNSEAGINWRLMINPALIATFVALVLMFAAPELPYVVTEALDSLSGMTVPGAMLVIGATLGQTKLKSVFGDWRVYLLCLAKLVIAPIVVWAVCRFFVPEPYLGILVVLSAMPTAAVTSMFTLEYGGDTETASRGVFITTILSVVTAPAMAYLLLG